VRYTAVSESPRSGAAADALRREFDRSFSEAPRPAGEPAEGFLSIDAGGEAYAVRLAEVAGLYVDRQIVALPSPLPELQGIVGIRGSISPVYDLASLLGHPSGDAGRWLLLTGRNATIALAFSKFDGHFRSTARDLARRDAGHASGRHVHEAVRVGGGVRSIINLVSLVETLTRRVRPAAPPKEG
jgi:chemotaxis signal transduction protein